MKVTKLHLPKVKEPVTFEIKSGELLVITGQNGIGKSTLFKMILGLDNSQSRAIEGAKSIAYLPDPSESYFIGATPRIYFNLLLAHHVTPDFADRLSYLRQQFAFDNNLDDTLVQHLSLGEKRKLLLVGALATQTKLVLLDEPFAGLDEQSSLRLAEIIDKQRENDRSFILITHEKMELLNHPSQILNLVAGQKR